MLSFVLSLILLWAIAVWLNRQKRSPHIPAPIPIKPLPIRKAPTKPQFLNSQPITKELDPKPQPTIDFAALQRAAAQQRAWRKTVSPQTQAKLCRMVQGDREMVSRLVEFTRRGHPGQSEQWVWEKAIRDLERDRH